MGNKAAVLQAILFTAGDPLSAQDVMRGLQWTPEEWEEVLLTLERSLEQPESGLQLRRINDKVQLVTKPEFAEAIREVLSPVIKRPLSQSALETLSIIAYKQPVTKAEIEAIRGVRCDYALEVLRTREIIREAGHKDTLGRPLMYATTEEFLKVFGLTSLDQLPAQESLQMLPEQQHMDLPQEDAVLQIVSQAPEQAQE